MTTTNAIIENELSLNGLSFTGYYSYRTKMIYNAILDIKHFGIEALERSTLGAKGKEIQGKRK